MPSSPEISRQVSSSAPEIQGSLQKKINYKNAAKITAVVISILGFAALGCFIFHNYVGFQAAGSWINQTFSNMTVWQGIVYITLPTVAIGIAGIGIYTLRVCLKSKKEAPTQTEGSQPNSPTVNPIESPTADSQTHSQHSSNTASPTRSPSSDASSATLHSSPEGAQSPDSQTSSITSSPIQSPTPATEDIVEVRTEELGNIYPQPLQATSASSTLFVDPQIVRSILKALSLSRPLRPQQIIVGFPIRRPRSNPVSVPPVTVPHRLTVEELPDEMESPATTTPPVTAPHRLTIEELPDEMESPATTTTYTGRGIHGEDHPLSEAASNLVDLFQAPGTSDRSSTRLFDREISSERPTVDLADLLRIHKEEPMSLSDILRSTSASSEDHELARRLEE